MTAVAAMMELTARRATAATAHRAYSIVKVAVAAIYAVTARTTMMMTNTDHDSRWLCANCGDLDYLNEDDLCRKCAPEPVAEFAEICCRALCGERVEVEPQWRIG